MPKIKTHKGTAKRFKITGSGKIMQCKGLKSHLRRKKPGRTKRMYDEMLPVSAANVRRVRKLLPYG